MRWASTTLGWTSGVERTWKYPSGYDSTWHSTLVALYFMQTSLTQSCQFLKLSRHEDVRLVSASTDAQYWSRWSWLCLLGMWPVEPRGHPVLPSSHSAWALNIWEWENCSFWQKFPFVSESLLDGTVVGCYGTLIGSHRCQVDQCQFRWAWRRVRRVRFSKLINI